MEKKPRNVEIDGMKLPPIAVPEIYREAVKFNPGKGDVIVATFPKCGTTWTLQIVSLILRNGEPITNKEEFFAYSPFLELTPMELISRMPKPRLLKTHLPFGPLKYNSDAKYIYVARHPADYLVSNYHHLRFFTFFFYPDGTLDDVLDLFLKGETDYGDYFDHLLTAYKNRNKPNVLILTFESIKTNHRGACLKIARFLGEEYHKRLLEEDEAVLKKVLKYSSLEYMKTTVNEFWKHLFNCMPSEEDQKRNPIMKKIAESVQEAKEKGNTSEGMFIRKGIIGEGKMTLSPQQCNRLNEHICNRTTNSDVMSLWKDI
ncbi:sulfotransferase family cytosolic 1B member 1 [Nephila pilipes]|uniref:Sulfotransferase family cytosolic 1B member 1 n=1 Tax=Nephila pilipes TaxID=299642 RepID=A0A8X6UA98_NEPPI|nr:sulfotransferase family cytosolic 1B member 1 [Nephila pilipes]